MKLASRTVAFVVLLLGAPSGADAGPTGPVAGTRGAGAGARAPAAGAPAPPGSATEPARGPAITHADAPADPPGLVELRTVAPGIRLDLRYATADNVVGRPLYTFRSCWLLPELARRLAEAQRALEGRGLGLKVWDCYRPHRAQWELWRAFPRKGYVGDPREGSHHNRGAAVDLTLVDAAGAEQPMPTAFDAFTRAANHDADVPEPGRGHRATLLGAMQAAGLRSIRTEWWHYQLRDARRHPLLDVVPRE